MSEKPPPTKDEAPRDEAEAVVDELLAELVEALPADLLTEGGDFIKDALAAHPVARLLAERVRARKDRERSGDEIAKDAVLPAGGKKEKAGGDER